MKKICYVMTIEETHIMLAGLILLEAEINTTLQLSSSKKLEMGIDSDSELNYSLKNIQMQKESLEIALDSLSEEGD